MTKAGDWKSFDGLALSAEKFGNGSAARFCSFVIGIASRSYTEKASRRSGFCGVGAGELMTEERGRAKTSVELSPARSSRESCRASNAREEVGEKEGRSEGSRMYTTILRCEREADSMLVPAQSSSVVRKTEIERETHKST